MHIFVTRHCLLIRLIPIERAFHEIEFVVAGSHLNLVCNFLIYKGSRYARDRCFLYELEIVLFAIMRVAGLEGSVCDMKPDGASSEYALSASASACTFNCA